MTQPHANGSAVHVLISEADDAFYERMHQALTETTTPIETHRLDTHAHMMRFLHREPPFTENVRPSIVLMGTGIHECGESDTLDAIKSDPALRRIPIVLLTHPDSAIQVERLYEKGANSCIRKPHTPDACREFARLFADYWFDVVSVA